MVLPAILNQLPPNVFLKEIHLQITADFYLSEIISYSYTSYLPVFVLKLKIADIGS